MPDPVFLLCLVQCIEIQQNFPFRLCLAVFLQRGTTPDSGRIGLVTPEVVIKIALLADVGNAHIGIENAPEIVAQGSELLLCLKFLFRILILLPDPGQCLFARYIFEPEIGVFDACRGLCNCCCCHGG